jgi:hypothetical protein
VNKKDILGEKFTLASFDELSFHKLVEAVGKVAEPSIDENTLKEVEHYHSIRNKIYHLGEGIIPAKEKFEGYLQLADELLMNLLDKNKETEDTPIEYTFETLQKMGQEMLFGVIMHGMAENFKDFQFNIAVAAEVFAPKITRKSFEKSLKELRQTYGDSEDDDVSIRYESQLKRIKGFQDITYIEIDDIDFIDEILNDITYLYLVILETRKAIDNNDLKEYIKYRGFVDRFIYNNNIENATKEDKEQLRKFQKWASNIESKLNALINNQKPTNHERSEL